MSTFFVFAIFLISINGSNSYSKFCDTRNLFRLGTKALCESESELSISCLKNPKKAYIQCQSGYYNENITTQIINCMDDGQWSEIPLQCQPKCVTNPSTNQLTLLQKDQITYPTSYVEVFRNKPIDDKPNKFPGMILFERQILSNCDFVSNEDYGDSYSIRIFDAESSFKEIRVFYNEITRIIHDNKEFCIFYLSTDYIKYDKNIMPNCIANEVASKLNSDFQEKLLPVYKKKCYIPDFDNTRTEVVCYDQKSVTFFETLTYDGAGRLGGSGYKSFKVDCAESADEVIIRCRLGTNNTKSNEMPFISKCKNGEWTHTETNSENCVFVCGEIDAVYDPSTSQLLFKGLETNIISAPWHVAIFANNSGISDTFEQICGGSIIHSNMVISAAHCFYNEPYGKLHDTSNYLVGAGKKYRTYDIFEQAEYYNGVKHIRIPPTYQPQPTQNDIAILILYQHFKFTSHIKPVCIEWLPYNDYLIEDRVIGRTFGWGSTSKSKGPSNGLLTIDLVTKVNNDCKKLVNPNLRSEISSDKFCATNSDNATACRGDSGGGFVIKRGFGYRGYYILAGVISVGLDVKNYCSSGFISMFSNIQFYQDFIKSVIAGTRYN